ncbi:hypothetical protein BU25DRAFT_244141 [Macroventuria anomochaeta]|uniref:Uncharacterized protein n=1 Tax=Macroventuria anomochaeta TaxID=301207 RepID=A0ACB6SBF4_9PLEO|nr:uncharacterized protein BU25DRAFT_244141 [Macroventuria anomochaeta]KAF2630644.1 hypothetical protein BU25DRAFT_244141 [Macroventuria anomochaeta]
MHKSCLKSHMVGLMSCVGSSVACARRYLVVLQPLGQLGDYTTSVLCHRCQLITESSFLSRSRPKKLIACCVLYCDRCSCVVDVLGGSCAHGPGQSKQQPSRETYQSSSQRCRRSHCTSSSRTSGYQFTTARLVMNSRCGER